MQPLFNFLSSLHIILDAYATALFQKKKKKSWSYHFFSKRYRTSEITIRPNFLFRKYIRLKRQNLYASLPKNSFINTNQIFWPQIYALTKSPKNKIHIQTPKPDLSKKSESVIVSHEEDASRIAERNQTLTTTTKRKSNTKQLHNNPYFYFCKHKIIPIFQERKLKA